MDFISVPKKLIKASFLKTPGVVLVHKQKGCWTGEPIEITLKWKQAYKSFIIAFTRYGAIQTVQYEKTFKGAYKAFLNLVKEFKS